MIVDAGGNDGGDERRLIEEDDYGSFQIENQKYVILDGNYSD